jgi:putative acetyltransferase
MSNSTFHIRQIISADNAAVAGIIRSVMPEFGASGPGFAIHDAEVDDMAAAYSQSSCAYFVVELDRRIRGGGGIAPLDGEPDICELRKMYFLPELRGCGAGAALIGHCLDTARTLGYRACYLETLTGMDAAQKLYEKQGFVRIPAALGNTGHFGCNRFYLREFVIAPT